MRRLLLSLITILPITLGIADIQSCPRPIDKIDAAQEKCLAATIYGEARGESLQGQVAVAYTVVNRAVNKTLCQVALANKQYSVFNNNPSMRAIALSKSIVPSFKNPIDKTSWDNAIKVSHMVLQKNVQDPTNGATHYYAPTLMAKMHYKIPKWITKYKLVAVIDGHKFYKTT